MELQETERIQEDCVFFADEMVRKAMVVSKLERVILLEEI